MLTILPDGIAEYASAHSSPEPAVLSELAQETREKTTESEMLVGHIEGLFLKCVARSIGARHVLEIGTFTGYSALALAEGIPDGGRVITCDIDHETTEIAKRKWAQSPHGHKIELRLGRALDTIQTIDGSLDLVFIDADKESYIDYWEATLPKVRPGGVILADNVLWSGDVLAPQDDVTRAIAAFNDHARNDPRVDLVMLTIRDGITFACRR